jgi:signal transduction histidine kinase
MSPKSFMTRWGNIGVSSGSGSTSRRRAIRLGRRVCRSSSKIERSVRRLTRDIRPAALADLGLVTALGMCVEEWVTGYSHE